MDANVDRFYKLLPAIYRQRDAERGWQLQALLRVLTEQANIVEADIAQLYDNWFIETCQDWVVPYIGELVGYQRIHEAGEPGDVKTAEGRLLNKILISRNDVANTVRDRRRKGTLSLLEDLARDVAGWRYAHAVEFYKLLGTTQATNYLQLGRGRTVNVRDTGALKHVGGPFTQGAHTIDVRRITSQQALGRYNLSSIGLFIWRLKVYSVTCTQARHLRDVKANSYTFSPLGNDMQLFTNPQPRGKTVDELNFPNLITRQAFSDRKNDYYGPGKSIQIWQIETSEHATVEADEAQGQRGQRPREHDAPRHGQSQHAGHGQYGAHDSGGQPTHSEHGTGDARHAEGAEPPEGSAPATEHVTFTLVPPERIIPANLSGWHYHPEPGYVAVDPVLGRIAFHEGHQHKEVRVSYYYAFSDDIGGGEYHRPLFQPQVTPPQTLQRYYVGRDIDPTKVSNGHKTLREALAAWTNWKDDHSGSSHAVRQAVIEIVDSGVYNEQLDIHLNENENLQIRAANEKRPVIRIVSWNEDLPDVFTVTGETGSRFTLDGLLITGSAVLCKGDIADLTIRHCTLVPGLGLHSNCCPHRPEEPSLILLNIGKQVTIEHCILGSILIDEEEEEHEEEELPREDPLPMSISDSILDATDPELDVISAYDERIARTAMTIMRCTAFGRVRVHSLELAENSIFDGIIRVARRQHGCMRFCSIRIPAHAEEEEPANRTPRRYHCQPDLVVQALLDVDPHFKTLPPDERKKLKRLEQDRVRPLFNSTLYGMATYCQLALACAQEIKRGADDQSETGVFHELFQPQRETNLRTRLDDFTPAGMETGIIYVELRQPRPKEDTSEGIETSILYIH